LESDTGRRGATHAPVLVDEVIDALAPERGGRYVDCTVGLGGHTRALIEGGAAEVIGLDRDEDALAIAGERLRQFGDRVVLLHADYRALRDVLAGRHIDAVDGLLADLGLSSMQLEAEQRGFSFMRDEPLDMRMDRSRGPTAAELLGEASEEELADVIFRFGEERFSRRIARAIVHARGERPIMTTGRLADVVRRAVPYRGHQRIDPATRTFQAVRIWVNRELEGLDAFIGDAVLVLRPGGRVAIISFHSLEDRVVKHTLRALERDGRVRLLTRRPVTASDAELGVNPRARSAKLRAAERVS
jgi:16S rRNA (cytosine1402-N4)-methyltransferase